MIFNPAIEKYKVFASGESSPAQESSVVFQTITHIFVCVLIGSLTERIVIKSLIFGPLKDSGMEIV